jgi:hypothetical protein
LGGKHLLIPIANTLLTGLCVLLGIYSFGQPLFFDSISTVSFIVIAFIFRYDINIKTVCILLLVENTLVNSAFLTLNNNLIYVACAFTVAIISLYFCRHDKLAKPIALLLVITLIAEVYWYKIDYPAPQIYFYFFKISLSLIVRQLLLYRPHGLNYYLNSGASILRLDWFVYKTIWVACVVECAMISEFLIRHLLGIQALYLYNSYEYIMHALAVWVLWLVIREAIKIQHKGSLQA